MVFKVVVVGVWFVVVAEKSSVAKIVELGASDTL